MTVVAKASNGREAVELWKRYRPDVSLLDLRMPTLNWFVVGRTRGVATWIFSGYKSMTLIGRLCVLMSGPCVRGTPY